MDKKTEITKKLEEQKDKIENKDIKKAIDKKLKYVNKPVVK